MFGMDPEEATVTHRALLDRAAGDKLRLHFFHAPFAATGFVARNGVRYEYFAGTVGVSANIPSASCPRGMIMLSA